MELITEEEAEARFFIALREDQPCCKPAPCDWHRYAGLRQAGMLAAIAEMCTDLGLMWHHGADSRRNICPRGFPDTVIAGPGGTLFRELKTAHHYLSPDQRTWAWMLRAAGADFRVWTTGSFRRGEVRAELTAISYRTAA